MNNIQLLVRRLTVFKTRFLAALNFPHNIEGLQPALIELNVHPEEPDRCPRTSILKDIIGDGFTWAVQTSRRSVERRLTRKLSEDKKMKPKKNLVMCNVCGHFNEARTICGNCYQKVRDETERMREAIQNEWKMEAVNEEVIVMYDNEEKNKSEEFWRGKRIVEMKKERPDWFHQNLKVKTRNQDASAETSLQLNTKSIISHVK